MIKYFPFTPDFNLRMGTVPLSDEDTLVETDRHYLKEVQLKRSLLEKDHGYYFDALDESWLAQWETVEVILENLLRHDPQSFSIQQQGEHPSFYNKKLNERVVFAFDKNDSIPLAPLDFIGRHIQEDLILLNPIGEVVAGQLCFPSGWALHEKIGKQFLEVHAPLPMVAKPMIQTANRFLERIPSGKSFSRNNWGIRLGDQLDLSSQYSANYREAMNNALPGMSHDAFGEKIFLRVEHQTLTRLMRSGYVLFTIHTYNTPLKAVSANQEHTRTMLSFLKGCPGELIEYKVMTPLFAQLINYLEASLRLDDVI